MTNAFVIPPIGLYFLYATLVAILTMAFFHILGTMDLLSHKYGRSRFALLLLFLFLPQLFTGQSLFTTPWVPTYPIYLLWCTIFPYVYARTQVKNGAHILFRGFGTAIPVALSSTVLLFFASYFGSKIESSPLQMLAIIMVTIAGALLTLIPLSFLAYYLFYGVSFVSGDMLIILQTHKKEVRDYLSDMVGWPLVVFSVLAFSIYLILYGILVFHAMEPLPVAPLYREQETLFLTLQLLLLLSALFLFIRWTTHTYPYEPLKNALHYMRRIEEAAASHKKRFETITLSQPPLSQQLLGSVILVIGESANRDYMSIFGNNHAPNTTPWLTEEANRGNMYLYPKAYANYANTAFALPYLLTSVNQYNGKTLEEAITILDVAKKTGYTTWWISNHERMNKGDFVTSLVANLADHERWTTLSQGDDQHLLSLLEEIPTTGNHFIVLHIIGSHTQYCARYPKEFPIIEDKGLTKKEREYSTSLRYTDSILEQIHDYGKKHLHLQAMLYCSDHGEDMDYSHTVAHFTYAMTHIPCFLYLSPTYRTRFPEVARALKNNQTRIFTNDLIFELLSGLLRAPNNYYESQYDISSAAYALTPETARTMHGDKRITDDPDWREE